MTRATTLAVLIAGSLCAATGEEFFEKKIRPVLVQKCFVCHSEKLKTPMGGLRLDSAAALRKGGDSGPAIVTGDPDKSLLVRAIRYDNLKLKMPPDGKLPAEAIADIENWIRMGAPDPRRESAPPAAARTGIDFTEAKKFWAFQAVGNPAVPAVKDTAWPRTPVDRFLLTRLEEKGIKPAPPIDRQGWLRRVTYDLIGLPPAPAEIQGFLADSSTNAEENVVDRLLASQHYGERWARHWLDLVRFVETNGHEFDNDKLDAWRYRDYVIRCFNSDVPYDVFVKEQIAGDLLAQKRLSSDGTLWESPIGTSMYWFGEVLNSATDSVKARADSVDNQLDVIGKTFLGMTISCARCHDHKFDPIPTADYYSLAGIMHSTYMREAVIDSPAHAARIASLHQKIADINAEIRGILKAEAPVAKPAPAREGDIVFEDFEGLGFDNWTVSGQAFGYAPSFEIAPNQPLSGYRREGMANSFGAGSNKLVGTLTSKKFRMPKLWVHVRLAGDKADRSLRERAPLRVTVVADDHKSEHFVPSGNPAFEWRSIRMTKEIGRICYIEIVDRSRDGHIAVDKIVFSDSDKPPAEEAASQGPAKREDLAARLPAEARQTIERLQKRRAGIDAQIPESAFAMISADERPHNVRLHIRGSHENLGDEVPRQWMRVFSPEAPPKVQHGSGRLELAGWIGSSDNPLAARVMVNRIWKHHFGQGLVRSTDNFGKLGETPSHPELLDYLARRFMESGWSVKAMHRLMVLSSAYRMSNTVSEQAAKADPRNELLHHMPVRRLEGEAIRDALLAVSGKLDRTMYGPGIPPHISKYQDGRGKPVSGPLDGNGRRSIYIQARRNFLTPMFLAFDYPLPVSTTGVRGVSTVPAQALLMMNNEFVDQASVYWARRVMAAEGDPAHRLEQIYREAFARKPEASESKQMLEFIKDRGGDEKAWTELCHVLFNAVEFIYVR
jgi:cytochrome c553